MPFNSTSRTFLDRYGPVALVAGASEGLGAAYAEALASRGLDLVLVARRPEVLAERAASLRAKYKITVLEIAVDLGAPGAAQSITDKTSGLDIGCLVYNAAYSHIGPFLDADMEAYERLTAVNVSMPLALVHHFGALMLARGKGGIVLMSSLAGFQGAGFLAGYGATKAFNRVLAEGLWYEWEKRGVAVMACCAGATATPNYLDTAPAKPHFLAPKPERPEAVAEACLAHLGRTPSFVSGRSNRLVSFLMQRLMPRRAAINMMGDALRAAYHFED